MLTTSQIPSHPKAYTILESLVLLGILTILSWVGMALYKHHEKTVESKSLNPPAPAAEVGAAPLDPLPTTGSGSPKE
jgi:hypothetical protein